MVIATWIICGLMALYWFIWSAIMTHAMIVTDRYPFDAVFMAALHAVGAVVILVIARLRTRRR